VRKFCVSLVCSSTIMAQYLKEINARIKSIRKCNTFFVCKAMKGNINEYYNNHKELNICMFIVHLCIQGMYGWKWFFNSILNRYFRFVLFCLVRNKINRFQHCNWKIPVVLSRRILQMTIYIGRQVFKFHDYHFLFNSRCKNFESVI